MVRQSLRKALKASAVAAAATATSSALSTTAAPARVRAPKRRVRASKVAQTAAVRKKAKRDTAAAAAAATSDNAAAVTVGRRVEILGGRGKWRAALVLRVDGGRGDGGRGARCFVQVSYVCFYFSFYSMTEYFTNIMPLLNEYLQYLADAVEEWIDMDATSFRKPQQRGAAVVRAAKAKEKARLAEAARRAPRGGKRGRSRKRSRSRAAAVGGDATAPLRTTDLLGIADASAATQAATEAALLADATRQSEIRAQRLVLFKQQNAQMGKVLDYLLREDRCVNHIILFLLHCMTEFLINVINIINNDDYYYYCCYGSYEYFSSAVNTEDWEDYVPKLEERLGIATLMDLGTMQERWRAGHYTVDAYAKAVVDADAGR